MLSPVTVIGGAGRTGRLVAAAIHRQGAGVRVLRRSPRRGRRALPAGRQDTAEDGYAAGAPESESQPAPAGAAGRAEPATRAAQATDTNVA